LIFFKKFLVLKKPVFQAENGYGVVIRTSAVRAAIAETGGRYFVLVITAKLISKVPGT
jgi:hypothetical protein